MIKLKQWLWIGVLLVAIAALSPHSALTVATTTAPLIRVPADMDLQTAIYEIADGGVVEIATGTYVSSDYGFRIGDPGKSFTIRAAAGATVVLSGNHSNPVLYYINSDPSRGGVVRFENLTFANGYSDIGGRAGGVALQRSQAEFVNCTFQNNVGHQDNPGGAVLVAMGAHATFENCTWTGNVARTFGGGLAVQDSEVYVTNSQFINNRVNLPGHLITSAGGGIHIGNSNVTISSTSFQSNQAGYAGGAVYVIGNWASPITQPRAQLLITGSTFTNNRVVRDSSVPYVAPTEGGAVHAEDQTIATITDSNFTGNTADIGGAVNLYRAQVWVTHSFFENNRALGTGAATGFGGTFSAVSNDTSADGLNNWPVSELHITNSIVKNSVVAGQTAAGLYATGDTNRAYGLNGVIPTGSIVDNRARITLKRVIFYNTDVQETAGAPGTGVGGAITTDMVDLTLDQVMVMFADAVGGNSSGGGMALLNNSLLNAMDTTIVRSSTQQYGGGMFVQGSEVHFKNGYLIENTATTNYGAAIFSSPFDGRGVSVTGALEDSLISHNIGRAIFDDDRNSNVINDVRYNGNAIFGLSSPGEIIYYNWMAGNRSVASLNTLTIERSNGPNTPKSQRANIDPPSLPVAGILLAIPSAVPPGGSYYLAYAWTGEETAMLNGNPVSNYAGLISVIGAGVHTLSVGNANFTLEVKELIPVLYLPSVMR